MTKDKKRHYIIIKGLIHKGYLDILNMYALNKRSSKYIK